jgi:choice-of-anchor C domain-containing protein
MKNLLSILALTLGLGLTSVSAQLVNNGSFENGSCDGAFITVNAGGTDITGWTVGGSVDFICSYWQASQGARSIDLNGLEAGSISQTLTTTAGFSYAVTFDMSGNPDGSTLENTHPYYSPSIKSLGVSVDGGAATPYSFDTGSGNTATNMMWVPNLYNFTATSNSTVLTFASLIPGAFGPALDNVQVVATTGYVCHRDKGKPGQKTLIVGLSSIPSHVSQHGDTAGPCTGS